MEVAPRVPAEDPVIQSPVQARHHATQQATSAREAEELRQAIAESLRTHQEPQVTPSSQPPPNPAWRRRNQTEEAEAQALEKLNFIVGNCLQSNAQFVDPEFAPSSKALYANGRCRRRDAEQLLIVQHYEKNGREISWRRPGEILQRPDDLMMEFESREEMILTMHQIAKMVEWRVFQSDPRPNDISQGALGNCWFCGSLAAVAEKPKLVKQLFADDCSRRGELSQVGVYLLRLCDGGEWRFVVLDDNFPCNSANMLAYSGARRNQLWVPLVEKAFAKLRGCYEETEGGNPSEGLRLLTGWPSIVLHLQPAEGEDGAAQLRRQRSELAMPVQASCPFEDEEILWARLVSASSADLIMCGSCGHVEGISREQYRNAGLSPSHCYSLVQVASACGGTRRLIKLRNPWGTGLKWNGDFSDGDAKNWTPQVKAEVGATDLGQDSGIFWMTLQDLRRYFNSITICPYREGWSEFRVTAAFPETFQSAQPGVFLGRPTTGQPTEALLSLMQPEERQTATTMTADLGLALFRVPVGEEPVEGQPYGSSAGTRRKLEFIDSTPRQVHDSLLQEHFLEGRGGAGVLAVPLSFNQRAPVSASREASLSFGPKPFTFCCFSGREVPGKALDLAPDLVRTAIVAHIKRHGSIGSQSQFVRLWKLAESGLIVYVENASMNFVEVGVELSELFNVTVSRGVEADANGQVTMKTRDMIPPMHGMVVFVAAAMPAGHTYRFSSRFIPRLDMDGHPAHSPPLARPCDPLHDPCFLDGPELSDSQQFSVAGRRPVR